MGIDRYQSLLLLLLHRSRRPVLRTGTEVTVIKLARRRRPSSPSSSSARSHVKVGLVLLLRRGFEAPSSSGA